jgi:hypothetical protein
MSGEVLSGEVMSGEVLSGEVLSWTHKSKFAPLLWGDSVHLRLSTVFIDRA